MSFTDINEWIVGETDIFLAPQGVLGTKDADCNLRQRSRTVSSSIWRSATWTLRIISLAFAMILLIAGSVSARSITVNGANDGTTVSPGASMLVAVADGPGHATDWIGVCNSVDDVTPGLDQCDGAGYSWDYLNCTQTAPATGVTSVTCSLSAPDLPGDYSAVFFSNNVYYVLASAPFHVTPASSPSITVNGTSGGTTVSPGASMSVEVADGPGNRADWIGVCNAGATPAFEQCDKLGYSWDYLNCTQTYPSTGSTSASCNLAAPSAEGDYIVGFFSNDIYTVLASAPFTVSGGGGGGGGPSLVQTVLTSLFVGGVSVDNQQCTNTWGPGSAAGGSAIGTGDTVVGYVHLGDSLQDGTTYLHPNWISDNLGNTYTMQTVNWVPWGETITIFYGTNVQGNPTSFTIDFSQYPASGGTIPGPCDLGFAEYSGVSGVNATAGPTISPGANPSLSITTTAPSVVFLYGALNWDSFGTLHNTGYTGMIDDHSFNGMVVWQGNVPAGQTTYVWDNGEGASGTCSYDPNGCPAGVAAVALQ